MRACLPGVACVPLPPSFFLHPSSFSLRPSSFSLLPSSLPPFPSPLSLPLCYLIHSTSSPLSFLVPQAEGEDPAAVEPLMGAKRSQMQAKHYSFDDPAGPRRRVSLFSSLARLSPLVSLVALSRRSLVVALVSLLSLLSRIVSRSSPSHLWRASCPWLASSALQLSLFLALSPPLLLSSSPPLLSFSRASHPPLHSLPPALLLTHLARSLARARAGAHVTGSRAGMNPELAEIVDRESRHDFKVPFLPPSFRLSVRLQYNLGL
eukprot:1205141-Rhodomonas_salina.1